LGHPASVSGVLVGEGCHHQTLLHPDLDLEHDQGDREEHDPLTDPAEQTTIPGDEPAATPDLVRRDFTAETPGTKLVGDITSWDSQRVAA
jgi:hypothetical protein